MNNNQNEVHVNVQKAGKTGLFTNYIFKAIPLAFDESLSYYECLCGLLNYLKNTVIPVLNNNADAIVTLQNNINEFEANVNQDIANFKQTTNESIAIFEQNVNQTVEQLQNFVNTYFDNLDVQDEIDHKLDKMVEDGTLENILLNYAYVQKVYPTYNDLISDHLLITGMKCVTLGYNTINDGGGATYYVRNKTNNDVDNAVIKVIGNLVVEMITNDKYNIKSFGYTEHTYVDSGVTFKLKDITESLQNLINYFYNNRTENVAKMFTIYIPNDNYYINNTIDLKELCVAIVGDQVGIKHVGKYTRTIKDKILTDVDGSVFTNGELNLKGVNFNDISSTNESDHILIDCKAKTVDSCWTLGYDIVFNGGIEYVSVIQNNQFIGIKKYFLKSIIIDSIICNNYINGEGTDAIGISGNISHSAITNNYIDFFKVAIQGNPFNNTNIIGNQFDYCTIGIKLAGAEGVTISSNNFAHMSKYYYNNSNNNYPADSDQALNDWICIKLDHTEKSIEIHDNTGTSIDLFIECYNTSPNAYTSIHSSGNTICKMNTESSHTVTNKFIKLLYFYTNRNYNNDINFEELNYSTYSEAPTNRNSCNGQEFYYNNVKYKNVNGNIIAIGILDYEKFTKFNFTDFNDPNSTVNIDLTVLPENIDKSDMYLEINTMVDYSLLQTSIYKIVRNGTHYKAVEIVKETSTQMTSTVSITDGVLSITSSGSATTNTKTMAYRIFGI